MVKRLLFILLFATICGAHSGLYAQDVQKAPIENEQLAVSITVNESTVHVKNAAQMVLEVYNITGVKVCSHRIDSADKAIELTSLPKGCYILKIGKIVRKVYLR